MRHGHSLLESLESCVALCFLHPLFFPAIAVALHLISASCLPLFFSRAVKVDGCALRVRARTPEIFGLCEIAEISNRAVITQIHKNI